MEPATVTGEPTRARTTRGQRGFTLIELLIVMVIIVILAGVSLATYSNSVRSANEAALAQDLFQMREALDQYYADKNKYPATLSVLVDEKYLRVIPADPFTKSAETWQEILSEPEPGNPLAEQGVQDVKSGSDREAFDGRKYSEW
jgi:general secretion pathway protein G